MIERKAVKADGCSLRAVICTLNEVDSDNDVILPGAFPTGRSVPVLQSHDAGSLPIGKVTIREVGDEVIAEGKLLDEASCAWLRHDHETGPVQSYSWGFLPTQVSFGEVDGEPVRFIEKLDLLEVSLVVRGASVGTRTLDVKSCGCGGSCRDCRTPTWEERLAAKYAARPHPNDRIVSKLLAGISYKRTLVEPEVYLAALDAAEDLGIECPKVYGLRPCRKGERADETLGRDETGVYSAGAVYVKQGLSRHESLVTVGHEVAHAAGITDEGDAESFGAQFAESYRVVAA